MRERCRGAASREKQRWFGDILAARQLSQRALNVHEVAEMRPMPAPAECFGMHAGRHGGFTAMEDLLCCFLTFTAWLMPTVARSYF